MTTPGVSHVIRVEERIKKGEVITATFLGEVRDSINDLSTAIRPPTQVNQPRDPDADVLLADETWVAESATTENETFTGVSSVTVTRFKTITLLKPDGTRVQLDLTTLLATLDS